MIAAGSFGAHMVLDAECNIFVNAMFVLFMYTASPVTLRQLATFKDTLTCHRPRTPTEDFFGMWSMGKTTLALSSSISYHMCHT